MFGSYQIQPTTPDDLPALGRFLIDGFGLARDASHVTEAALWWKYFEPCGVPFGPRSFLACSAGRIVGHVGIVPREFVVRGSSGPSDPIPALHFIDLLAAPSHPTAGLMLMKRGFQATEVQYALGGSADGQRIALVTGYECRRKFPTMWAVLHPTYRLRVAGLGRFSRLARVGVDLAR